MGFSGASEIFRASDRRLCRNSRRSPCCRLKRKSRSKEMGIRLRFSAPPGPALAAEMPDERNPEMLAAHTLAAMREGHDIIFQAGFFAPPFFGKADFLRRVEKRSRLGDWSYEAVDTKLARTAKAKFLIQLGLYSDLL